MTPVLVLAVVVAQVLDDEAFVRLAPLAAGLIAVRVEQLRILPPATDR